MTKHSKRSMAPVLPAAYCLPEGLAEVCSGDRVASTRREIGEAGSNRNDDVVRELEQIVLETNRKPPDRAAHYKIAPRGRVCPCSASSGARDQTG